MPQITDIEGLISFSKNSKGPILLITSIFLFIKRLIELQNFDMLKLDYSLSNVNKQHKIRFRLLLKTIFKGFLFYVILFIVISFILLFTPSNRDLILLLFIVSYSIYFFITTFFIKPYKNHSFIVFDTISFFILINLCILFFSSNKDTPKLSVDSIDTILLTSCLVGRVKLIIISSIICLLSIYSTSCTYINSISNYSFAYFYTNAGAKAYIYTSNKTIALCMAKIK